MSIAERLDQKREQRGVEKSKGSGIHIGREEGKTQVIKNVALNMILKDMDAKLVAEFTGMTIQEIDDLQDN